MGRPITRPGRLSRPVVGLRSLSWVTLSLCSMGALIAACLSLLLWWAVLAPVIPMTSSDVLAMSPPGGVIDRDQTRDFTLTRMVCMNRTGEAKGTRYFIGPLPGGVEYKLALQQPTTYVAGCNQHNRTIAVPASLAPGRYIYRASLEFCNPLRCETYWAADIALVIVGAWPSDQSGMLPAWHHPAAWVDLH